MASIFKTVSWQVEQLVGGIEQGSIRLPDLQRPFVWPTTKVRDLFDSMYRGYPVGELMFWDDASGEASRVIGHGSGLGGRHQIVDGQQRITSLYASIKGRPVRNSDYMEKQITISFNPFSERFEVRTPALAKSPQWIENIATYFESSKRTEREFIKRYESSVGELTDEQEDHLDRVFERLGDLKKYTFNVVHIAGESGKGLVADIFVRINSEGVRLRASDYILTWLSVFWPEGREQIEDFSRHSRITPQRASEIAGSPIHWTPVNPFLAVETFHVVRAMVAVGQGRARLQDAYTALQARDPQTGYVDEEKLHEQLNRLQQALPVVTDRVNWTEFIHAIQMAGFRQARNITSSMNVISSYILFLLGRTRFSVDITTLRAVIARWIFMAQLTGRYTGSAESQLSKDLSRLELVATGDADGFVKALDEIVDSEMTSDFWRFGMPQMLAYSNAALSPAYQCYLAALNILEAKMFMLDMPVSQWMDPTLPTVKGMEGHHLFPRAYLGRELGIDDVKRVNQIANYAPTDWATNILISDRPPAEYWPELLQARHIRGEELQQQIYWHALPEDWHLLDYDEFLARRRDLIAQVTRDAFSKLRSGRAAGTVDDNFSALERHDPSLRELVDAGLLRPGDLLDPVDPDWVVDAVITDDGTVLIDGEHEFDALDDAARFLDVHNISGLEFWALEVNEGLTPLTEVAEELGERAA